MTQDIPDLKSRTKTFALRIIKLFQTLPAERLADLQKENDELTAIFVSSVKTAKKNRLA